MARVMVVTVLAAAVMAQVHTVLLLRQHLWHLLLAVLSSQLIT